MICISLQHSSAETPICSLICPALKLWHTSPAQLSNSGTTSRVKLRGFRDVHGPASAISRAPASGQVAGRKFRLKPPSVAGAVALGAPLQAVTSSNVPTAKPLSVIVSARPAAAAAALAGQSE